MERITDKQLDYLVEQLNRALGLPLEPWTKDASGKFRANVGNIHIDSAYGGVRLEKMSNESGGVREYGHSYRMTKRELWYQLRGMLALAEDRTAQEVESAK